MTDNPSSGAASRRAFLAAGLVAPAAAALVPGSVSAAAQAPSGGSNRHVLKLGAVTYNIAKDWDVPTIIKNFTTAGLDAVELRTTHAHGVEISLSAAQRADVRKQFEGSGIKIGGLGTTCEYHSPDPAVLRKNIEETKQWCQLAKDIGAPGVKVRPNGMPKDVPEEKTLEQIGRALRECAQAATEAGVRIQLEVHGAETQRIPRIVKMLNYADRHPGFWICWNSNPTDLMDGGFDKNFALLKSRIGQVHMRDLYWEEYPFQRLINSLQDMKFDGYCFAELGDTSTDGVRVLKYWRGMFRQMEGIVSPPLSVPNA